VFRIQIWLAVSFGSETFISLPDLDPSNHFGPGSGSATLCRGLQNFAVLESVWCSMYPSTIYKTDQCLACCCSPVNALPGFSGSDTERIERSDLDPE
jgi:hypothetical protein